MSYHTDYYQKNKKSILVKVKPYREFRRKKLLSLGLCVSCGKYPINFERSKQRCSSCLDDESKRSKKYNDTHKEQIKTYNKVHGQLPKVMERVRVYKKILYKKHREKFSHDRKIEKYKRRKAEGTHTLTEWLDVLSKFGNRCLDCGTSENLERDHVIPISKGGSNYIKNIQPLCKTCNRRKWNKIIDFRPFGRTILDWT